MAFARNFGSLLRQSISRHTSSNGSTTIPLIYQALRAMSSSRLFIGGLPYVMDEQALRESFTEFGEVTEARVIYDRESGRSRGFGFVSLTSDEEAAAAIGAMDGKQLNGRIVHVNYATERRVGFGGGGDGYSGGYGSGGRYSQNDSYGSGAGGGYGQNSSYGQNDGYGNSGGYNRNDGYGNSGGYNRNDGYGNSGGYNQNDGYGNSGGYNRNDGEGFGSGFSQVNQNDAYGTGASYSDTQRDGFENDRQPGGYDQNDGLGSGTSRMADGKSGYDDGPHDSVSNMGKGY